MGKFILYRVAQLLGIENKFIAFLFIVAIIVCTAFVAAYLYTSSIRWANMSSRFKDNLNYWDIIKLENLRKTFLISHEDFCWILLQRLSGKTVIQGNENNKSDSDHLKSMLLQKIDVILNESIRKN